ncbi:MAG: hypothetical protein V9G04_17010 [Nocardioides sp.]
MFELTPLPGDPQLVASEAQRMLKFADRMQEAAATLRKLTNTQEYRSDAVEALRNNAADLALVMEKSRDRYHETGSALATYATSLNHAQQRASQAIGARGATDVVGAARDVAEAKATTLNPLLSPEERAEANAALHRSKARLGEQQGAYDRANGEYAAAQAEVEEAARKAMSRIKMANDRGIKDSFMDNFKGFKEKYLQPALEAITKVLSVVGDILTVVGIVVALVPGLQAIGLVVAGVGTAVKLLSIVTTITKLLIGDISLGEAVAAAVFLVIGAVIKFLRKKPKAFLSGMNARDAYRYSKPDFVNGHILWKEGGKGFGLYVVDELN